jgi:hypothetical protein
VCRQHTLTTSTPHATHTHTTCSLYITPHHYSTFGRSRITEHVLLRYRHANAPTADPYNPRSYQAGHPLALLNAMPQPPPSAQDLDTALEPSPVRGLKTPLVLAAPRSTTDVGRAADPSTRTDDLYRCDRPAPSHIKDQSSTQRSLPLACTDTLVSSALKSIPSPRLSASKPQSCTVRSIMHHHVTQNRFLPE